MGTTLRGRTPATTFDALIKVGDNSALSASLKTLSDGEGNDSPLKLSTAAVGIGSITNVETEINGKQTTLVSGSSIKTINSTSVLGSGDIAVQATLVSGTNIKSINSTSLLGSGDVAVQETLISGTNVKTINSTSLLGSGDVAVQETLVSGTNIKTINGSSLLGSGDISVSASAGGSDTQIQFNDSGSFGADSLFNWDNTNKRLGVGETTPTARVHIKGEGATSATTSLLVQNSSGTDMLFITDDEKVNARANFRVHHLSNSSRYTNLNWGSVRANDTGSELSIYGGGYASAIYLNGSTKSTASGATGIQSTGVLIAASVLQNSFEPEDSAQLQVDSTTKGFLPPRMTTTQVNNIEATAGLIVYDTSINNLKCYDGSSWNNLF